MNRKTVIFASAMIALLGIGVYMLVSSDTNLQTKEEAIRQAEEYYSQGPCTGALVPAIHRATNAEYTFTSGCLAPGWEAKR